MNERIKELAEQVYGSAHHDDFKFAELIIQDCLAQVAMVGVSNFEDDDSGDISWTVGKCIEMIKYRFEIKK